MTHGMTAVRGDPLARLDAWVLEELEALSGARERPAERARRRREPEEVVFDAPPQDAPLALDEAHFVQQVTEWLSGRPNADLILEEIWRNVVTPDALEEAEGETLASADDEDGLDDAAELDAEAPEGPARSADDTPPDEAPQA